MKHTQRLLITVLFFCGTAFADSNRREYRVEHYPKDSGNCHEVARAFGEKFSALTGIVTQDSRCEKIDTHGFNIVVRYQSPTVLPFVTTATTELSTTSQGIFATEAECRESLVGETSHFRDVTRLSPSAAYCFADPLADTDRWVLKIDAFGNPELKPFFASTLLFTQVLGWEEKEFPKALAKGLSDEGIDVRFAKLRPSAGLSDLNVFYYAATPILIKAHIVARVSRPEHCRDSLKEADRVFSSLKPVPAISFCGYSDISTNYEVTAIFPYRPSVTFSPSAESFTTFEACQAARLGLVEYYKTTLKRPVLAGLCSREDRPHPYTDPLSWRVTFLERAQ